MSPSASIDIGGSRAGTPLPPLPPLPPLDVDRAWLDLWYEPWRQMHAGWLDAVAGASDGGTSVQGAEAREATTAGDAWLARFRSPSPALRVAYRSFCDRFGIAADAPLPLDRLSTLPGHLPLDTAALDRAALALGRVAYASHCLAGSRHDLAHLFSAQPGEAPLWRDALRQAKARPLRADGAPPPAGCANGDLRRWALPLMGHLIEEALPGAWSRLRLRCDPSHVAPLDAGPRIPETATGLRRQAWRIWRNGASPATPS